MVYHSFWLYTMVYSMLNAVLTYCWDVWYHCFFSYVPQFSVISLVAHGYILVYMTPQYHKGGMYIPMVGCIRQTCVISYGIWLISLSSWAAGQFFSLCNFFEFFSQRSSTEQLGSLAASPAAPQWSNMLAEPGTVEQNVASVAVVGWSAWLRWVNPMIMMNIIIIIISIIT